DGGTAVLLPELLGRVRLRAPGGPSCEQRSPLRHDVRPVPGGGEALEPVRGTRPTGVSDERPKEQSPAGGKPRAAVLFICTGNYFRSRYAEHLFNFRAAERALGVRAVSRGLRTDAIRAEDGALSPYTAARLALRGIPSQPSRLPLPLRAEDLLAA